MSCTDRVAPGAFGGVYMWLPSRSAIMLLSMKWPSGSGPLHADFYVCANRFSEDAWGSGAGGDVRVIVGVGHVGPEQELVDRGRGKDARG